MSGRSHKTEEDALAAKSEGDEAPSSSPTIEVTYHHDADADPPTKRGETDVSFAVAAPAAPRPARRVAPPLPRTSGGAPGAPRPVTRAFEALGSSLANTNASTNLPTSEPRMTRAPLRPSRTPTQRPPSGVPAAPSAPDAQNGEPRTSSSGRHKLHASAGSYSMAAARAQTRLGLSAVMPPPTTTESAMRAVLPTTVELTEATERASGVTTSSPEIVVSFEGGLSAGAPTPIPGSKDSTPVPVPEPDTSKDLTPAPPLSEASDDDDGATLERFAASAPSALRVVRGFFVQVMQGTAICEGVPAAREATLALGRASQVLGTRGLGRLLRELSLGFATVDDGPAEAPLSEANRAELTRLYAPLAAKLPSAFALEEDTARREAVILDALLRQIPLVNGVVLAKLEARDVRTVHALASLDTPDTLAALTGIALPLAARMHEKAQTYVRDRRAGVAAAAGGQATGDAAEASQARAFDRERLMALAARLRFQHEGYEEAAKGWSDEAAALKKKLRQGRADAFLQLKVVLARMGELERLAELERLPFERRVDALEEFLDRVDDEASRSP